MPTQHMSYLPFDAAVERTMEFENKTAKMSREIFSNPQDLGPRAPLVRQSAAYTLVFVVLYCFKSRRAPSQRVERKHHVPFFQV